MILKINPSLSISESKDAFSCVVISGVAIGGSEDGTLSIFDCGVAKKLGLFCVRSVFFVVKWSDIVGVNCSSFVVLSSSISILLFVLFRLTNSVFRAEL